MVGEILPWHLKVHYRHGDRGQAARSEVTRKDAATLTLRDHRLAHPSQEQRTHRKRQESHQARKARSVWVLLLGRLPDPLSSLRRQARLGPLRHRLSLLNSKKPRMRNSRVYPGYMRRRTALVTAIHQTRRKLGLTSITRRIENCSATSLGVMRSLRPDLYVDHTATHLDHGISNG